MPGTLPGLKTCLTAVLLQAKPQCRRRRDTRPRDIPRQTPSSVLQTALSPSCTSVLDPAQQLFPAPSEGDLTWGYELVCKAWPITWMDRLLLFQWSLYQVLARYFNYICEIRSQMLQWDHCLWSSAGLTCTAGPARRSPAALFSHLPLTHP